MELKRKYLLLILTKVTAGKILATRVTWTTLTLKEGEQMLSSMKGVIRHGRCLLGWKGGANIIVQVQG